MAPELRPRRGFYEFRDDLSTLYSLAHAEDASCHCKIDPIGFDLENFNAAGKWQTEEGHDRDVFPIDPAYQFHNGPKFNDYFKLREIVAKRDPDFARGSTDEDLADEIAAATKAEDYSVSE